MDFSGDHNHYFPTKTVMTAMCHAFPELLSSYGSHQQTLNKKLSRFLDCNHTHIHLLHGVSQVFPTLRKLFEGRTVAIPSPTLAEYSRIFPDAITYSDSPGISDADLEHLPEEADVVVIVNPNTPTGTTLSSAGLYSLAQRNPNTTFLVDE